MTAKDVDDRLKDLLGDADRETWDTKERVAFINDAVTTIVAERRDAMIDTDQSMITVSAVTGLGSSDTLSIADRFLPHVVQFCAWKAFECEAGDKRHERKAATHKANFYEALRTI